MGSLGPGAWLPIDTGREIEREFPGLRGASWSVESSADRRYNCIAWAAGEDRRPWWPSRDKSGYWPPGIDRIASIDAFVAAFSKLGYSTVTEGDLSNNMDRVALYVDAVDNEPTHMARQCD